MRTNSREHLLIKRAKELLLKHKGKLNAISAREISAALGIGDGDTFINTRTIIDKTIRKFELPIAAHTNNPAGYYVIKNTRELYEYMGSLEGRKMQIEDKKAVVFWNYVKQNGGLNSEEDTIDLLGLDLVPLPRKSRMRLPHVLS